MSRNVLIIAGVLAVACVMVVPRFFAARRTGAGVDPSPPNAAGQVPAFPGQTRAPELRLITCGGPFDQATGHYLDNVVVFARYAV